MRASDFLALGLSDDEARSDAEELSDEEEGSDAEERSDAEEGSDAEERSDAEEGSDAEVGSDAEERSEDRSSGGEDSVEGRSSEDGERLGSHSSASSRESCLGVPDGQSLHFGRCVQRLLPSLLLLYLQARASLVRNEPGICLTRPNSGPHPDRTHLQSRRNVL